MFSSLIAIFIAILIIVLTSKPYRVILVAIFFVAILAIILKVTLSVSLIAVFKAILTTVLTSSPYRVTLIAIFRT